MTKRMVEYVQQTDETWNMALAYLQRIDQLIGICDQAKFNDNLLLYYKALSCIYSKVLPKLKKDEKIEARRLLDEVLRAKKQGMTHPKTMISWKPFTELEDYLMQMLENRKMLTPKGGDPRFAMA